MWKRLPFTKDLITSTYPKFHAMFVNGWPKMQNPNEKNVLKNESKFALQNSHNFKNLFKNLSALDSWAMIWSPSNSSQMTTKTGPNPSTTTKIITSHPMVTKFIHCHHMVTKIITNHLMATKLIHCHQMATKIITSHPMVTKFIHYHHMVTKIITSHPMWPNLFIAIRWRPKS